MTRSSSNKNLENLNTFGMKVRASRYIEYDAAEDLVSLDWNSLPQPVLQIGEGSNLLFTSDFAGTVLRSRVKGFDILEDRSQADDVYVRVGAGEILDEVAERCARKDWWGLENLSGIPGTVGASAVQNVGAYGVEAGDIIDSVDCFDISSRKFVTLSAKDCAFAYRDSLFKHERGRYAVVAVTFHLYRDFRPVLTYGNLCEEVERNAELASASADPYNTIYRIVPSMPLPVTPSLVRDTVKIIRENKLPDPRKIGSAGSFFKNPVVPVQVYEKALATVRAARGNDAEMPHFDLPDGLVKIPAAFLIEFCGLKGSCVGGAAVWDRQPLVLVNASGKATPEDVLGLENKIIEKIDNVFGIRLSAEVDHI